MENLLSKYRPSTLREVLGQPNVTRALKLFIKAPYSTAMLFHGESGVGKTAAAYALARDLGVCIEDEELGGLHEIASGEQTGDMVRAKLSDLRFRALSGSGWRVLIVNEADRMSTSAETIYLDGLEHLPAMSVVIFTTNSPERLSKRLRDRCEVYAFESDPRRLAPALKQLGQRVWKGEVGKGKPPDMPNLGMQTCDDLYGGHASFRLALQQLGRVIREVQLGSAKNVRKVQKQLAKDLLVRDQHMTVECDHCGHEQDVAGGHDSQVCEECGKTFELEWE